MFVYSNYEAVYFYSISCQIRGHPKPAQNLAGADAGAKIHPRICRGRVSPGPVGFAVGGFSPHPNPRVPSLSTKSEGFPIKLIDSVFILTKLGVFFAKFTSLLANRKVQGVFHKIDGLQNHFNKVSGFFYKIHGVRHVTKSSGFF